jgi:hypothetical protein
MVGASFHGVVARSHCPAAHSVGAIRRTSAIRPPASLAMLTWVLIVSAVIGLLLVVLEQDKWTSLDSWFVAILASTVMAMVVNQLGYGLW